jgi:hypothetical protein
MSVLSENVVEVLVRAGWKPGQPCSAMQLERWRMDLAGGEPEFVMFPAARDALARYGGLTVDEVGRGLEIARERFTTSPVTAIGEEDRFAKYGQIVGRRLYPIGEAGGGLYFLGIAEDGAVFAVGDFITELGSDIDEAISSLILGTRPRHGGAGDLMWG